MQRKVKKGILRHLYWILNTTAIVYSFIIAFFYWTMLHDPGKCFDLTQWVGAHSAQQDIVILTCPI